MRLGRAAVFSLLAHGVAGGVLYGLVVASASSGKTFSKPLDLHLLDVDLVKIGDKAMVGGALAATGRPPPIATQDHQNRPKQESPTASVEPAPGASPVINPGAKMSVAASATVPELSEQPDLVTLDEGSGGGPLKLNPQELAKWVRAHNTAPEYPRLARSRGIEGKVVVRAWVVPSGAHAEKVEIEQSSGSEILDQAVLEQVEGWKFPPFHAKQARMAISIPFLFRLRGE